ncbi:MAG: hypothetical protein Q4B50_01865, partial [Bacillota bacterium]|nr:hypothetical protein [Bacillota bacterium]
MLLTKLCTYREKKSTERRQATLFSAGQKKFCKIREITLKHQKRRSSQENISCIKWKNISECCRLFVSFTFSGEFSAQQKKSSSAGNPQ